MLKATHLPIIWAMDETGSDYLISIPHNCDSIIGGTWTKWPLTLENSHRTRALPIFFSILSNRSRTASELVRHKSIVKKTGALAHLQPGGSDWNAPTLKTGIKRLCFS